MINESTIETESTIKKERGGIISILEDIQKIEGFLPEQALRKLADETGWSLVDIYGIATFYKYFSLKPRGKHLISVCLGTACQFVAEVLLQRNSKNNLI
jgi:NADH:ubiquinone oxidoreductase subunit E